METAFILSWQLVKVYAIAALVAYMLGSISFAVIFSRLLAKRDVRQLGSGNAGATNVFRSIGIKAGIGTFVCDFAKGALAIVCSRAIFDAIMGADFPNAAGAKSIGMCIAGLFAVLGHIFPVYFNFKGGKGVLTLGGIIFILSPLRFACLIVIFAIVFYFTRTVSIGSCAVAIAYPIITLLTTWLIDYRSDPIQYSPTYVIIQTVVAVIFGAIVLITHRSNIKRILSGTEPKMVFKNNKKDDEKARAKRSASK
ncbi:MAG: glycerol-3-phosphate 1-O-acyltransferase PlsY [Clostridia bacterium]|nr:glycerol-3-phosphate 1-O-acyltransferase PlsY [Clostridia bacterium]